MFCGKFSASRPSLLCLYTVCSNKISSGISLVWHYITIIVTLRTNTTFCAFFSDSLWVPGSIWFIDWFLTMVLLLCATRLRIISMRTFFFNVRWVKRHDPFIAIKLLLTGVYLFFLFALIQIKKILYSVQCILHTVDLRLCLWLNTEKEIICR